MRTGFIAVGIGLLAEAEAITLTAHKENEVVGHPVRLKT